MYSTGGGNGMAISMSMMHARNDRRGKRAELPDEVARKLKSCSVLNCEDWRDLNSYTTYHCFPTGDKNQERWEIWTQLLRKSREDDSWIPFRGSLVCSHHFRPEDFVNETHSKRRKLIKNAIPSIFPTFTVDLDDPSYQLPDDVPEEDTSQGSEEEFIYADPSSLLDMNGEDSYELEYANADDDPDAGAFEDNAIQILAGRNNQLDTPRIASVPRFNRTKSLGNVPSSGIVTTVGQVKVLSTSSVLVQQPQKLAKKPPPPQLVQIPPNQIFQMNGVGAKAALKPISTTTSRQQPRMANAAPQEYINRKPIQQNKVNRQEIVKSLDSLPFSLNPDLEIEMVDPEEDLAAYRNRISELEQQNRSLTTMYETALDSLKQKYEKQLVFLRKRVKEQERLLNLHQISVANHATTIKKPRLS